MPHRIRKGVSLTLMQPEPKTEPKPDVRIGVRVGVSVGLGVGPGIGLILSPSNVMVG